MGAGMGPAEHVVHMTLMGLIVAVFGPAVLLAALRVAPGLDRWTPPAGLALPGFVLLHAGITLFGGPFEGIAMLVLLLGAAAFWAPVLGVRHRLPDAGRVFYLYLAMPLLDLAGVWLVATGDSTGGLAMIVGMLPMAAFTVALTWRWINGEERHALLEEAGLPQSGELT